MSPRIVTFISHPFRGNESTNRTQAAMYARHAWLNQRLPVLPHFAFVYLDEKTSRDAILESCNQLVGMSDELWICGNQENSSDGMLVEIQEAQRLKKRIFRCWWSNEGQKYSLFLVDRGDDFSIPEPTVL